MPSPIRVSANLFQAAQREAAAMHRSVAGQLEYWSKLGQAVEAAGLSVESIKEIFYRGRIASGDPFSRLLAGHGADVYEVPDSLLQEAKLRRQEIDLQAQKDGVASSSRMSPFANARVSARIREVRLDE